MTHTHSPLCHHMKWYQYLYPRLKTYFRIHNIFPIEARISVIPPRQEKMTRLSHVGNPSVYEAGDQRNVGRTLLETERELHQTGRSSPSRTLELY